MSADLLGFSDSCSQLSAVCTGGSLWGQKVRCYEGWGRCSSRPSYDWCPANHEPSGRAFADFVQERTISRIQTSIRSCSSTTRRPKSGPGTDCLMERKALTTNSCQPPARAGGGGLHSPLPCQARGRGTCDCIRHENTPTFKSSIHLREPGQYGEFLGVH